MRVSRVVLFRILVGVLIVGLFFTDLLFGTIWDGEFRVRIRGRVVDPAGKPVAGAWVMSVLKERVDDAEHLAETKDRILLQGASPYCFHGGALTRKDGTFEFPVDIPYGGKVGCSGVAYGRQKPPPFYGIEVCIVEIEGFARTVHDLKSGRWTRSGDGDLYARIDLGDITVWRDRER